MSGRVAADRACTPCRLVPPAFTRAVAFGVYGGELRELIGLLKFHGLRAAVAPLADRLAVAIADLADSFDPAADTFVVPVPLFQAKARERGFNQVDLLAAHALRQLRRSHSAMRLLAAPDLLCRVKRTESQFGLNPRQRRDNLRGAFAVPEPSRVLGRDVLLLDDIYTTGATARACAAVLQRAGARSVFVATLARAQTETVALWEGDAAFSSSDVSTATHRRA